MEIDKNNLKDLITDIKRICNESDFVAIDTELTGLSVNKTNFFDTNELRYNHLRDNVVKYAVTQFGLCAFKYNSDIDCVSYAPINFHLLPYEKSEKDNFVVNIETIHFLNKVKFDFNKSWRDGASFIRLSEYEKLSRVDKLKKEHELSLIEIQSDSEKITFENLDSLIIECVQFLQNNEEKYMVNDTQLSAYEAYIVTEHLAKKIGSINGNWIFPSIEYDRERNKKVIKIIKCDDYNKMKYESINEKYRKIENSLKEKVLLSELIKYIGETGKFIIGHNCFLDCLHMYDNFIGPLPLNYQDFKESFTKHFPNFIDTKYLVTETKHDVFKNLEYMNLEMCFEATNTLPGNPEYRLWDGVSEFGEENKFHTANYDAMITGKVFLNLLTEIAPNYNLRHDFKTAAVEPLKNHVNKFNLVRADIKTMNLNPLHKENGNGREDVFHMRVPEFWQTSDVLNCLSTITNKSMLSVYNGVKYDWIDSTSAMIRISGDIRPSDVITGSHDHVTITTFNDHYQLNNNKVMEDNGFTMAKTGKRKRSHKSLTDSK